jgi:fermentation-respiration switch protein FrsA (DUF1100 family)
MQGIALKRIYSLLGVISAIGLSLAVASAYLSGRRDQPVPQDANLAEQAVVTALRQRNEKLEDDVAVQRELLREQTLSSTQRSADEYFALFPAKFPAGDWRPAEARFEDCWFVGDDGLRLHGWYLHHPEPDAVVLHLHGNAGNLTWRAPVADYLSQQLRASILIFDYRGYGRSEGVPTIAGLLKDARAARRELANREKVAETDIVLIGESLGGAVAVDLAAEDGARGLVLENTFSSLRDVGSAHYPQVLVSVLVADKLNSAGKIGRYRGPLLQVHGTADSVVPLHSAKKLHAAANEPKKLLQLPGHDHNSQLPTPYYEALAKFIAELPK